MDLTVFVTLACLANYHIIHSSNQVYFQVQELAYHQITILVCGITGDVRKSLVQDWNIHCVGAGPVHYYIKVLS